MMEYHGGYMMDLFPRVFGIVGILISFIWVVMIVGVILLIVFLVRRKDHKGEQTVKSAVQILEERFARGEIDEVEYREKKQVLKDE